MKLEEPFLTDPKQIKAWLDSMGVKVWRTNAAGLVDVEGEVYLSEKLGSLTRLPVRFGKVGGEFSCDNNQLVSLEGAPKEVGRCFYCQHNQLVSLEGATKQVSGNFWCDYNKLESLEGAPEKVSGGFSCSYNHLVSLEGAPKHVGGNFYCHHNLLVDFKGMEGAIVALGLVATAPKSDGQDNVFVSLDGLPKELHGKVRSLDMQVMWEFEKKRAASLFGAKVAEELSSEVELG